MYYIISRADTPVGPWMLAWERAGIPVRLVPREQVGAALPGIDLSAVQHAFLLPDRAIRPQTLLSQLAATARNAGAEIRGDTPVRDLLREGGRVHGVATSAGEEVLGRLVILATGAAAGQAWSHIYTARPGENARYSLVALKTHLVAVQPDVGRMPFYVVDDGGFNHLPHHYTSVFGSNHWHPVQNPSDASVEPRETSRIWQRLGTLFPGHDRDACTSVNEWAGTTVQAMHLEQVVPGEAPLPTVIDHSDASPRYENLLSVFPGRATLWAQLAEQTRRTVLDRLDRRAVETALPPWSVRAAARHA
jgi:glycine/D-amino acid oxidase-like deaminating enzyme